MVRRLRARSLSYDYEMNVCGRFASAFGEDQPCTVVASGYLIISRLPSALFSVSHLVTAKEEEEEEEEEYSIF